MNAKELDKWFANNAYDLENKELNKILEFGQIKDKDVLVLGVYGSMYIAFKLSKYAKSVVAIHNDRKIINYCKSKNKNIGFRARNIVMSDFKSKQFDVIVSPWSGLHYYKNRKGIVLELNRILKDTGILLIEEADETSEFVKILNLITPLKKPKIKEKRDELKMILRKNFDIEENKLRTFYYFKNKAQFKKYFEKEIVFDEKKRYTEDVDKKLDKYIFKKRNFKVEEKVIFFVCKKKKYS